MAREKISKNTKNSNKLYVTSNFLTAHYAETAGEREQQETLKTFCQEYSMSDINMRKIFFRMLRLETNRILIESVIQEQDPAIQAYLDMKYRQNRSVNYLAMHLNVSISQLNNWKIRVLESVTNIMDYRLTIDDVYSRKKIINLIEVLSSIIAAKEQMDPKGELIDECWYRAIIYRYNQYNKLLISLNSRLVNKDNRINRAVIAKCEHPHSSKECLADACGISSGSFCRYLRQYEDSVRDYVYEKEA